MILNFVHTALALASATWGPVAGPAVVQQQGPSGPPAPSVEVWTDHDGVYHRGDRVRVRFQTDEDAYVTVFRVDTDGRVRVLFPLDPWEDNFARGGHKYEVEARGGGGSFRVDDYPGEGYLFAIASADPFNYTTYVRGDHWDYREIAAGGRITGDPYVALGDLISAIVPANYVAYSYDVAPYYVDQHYEYPRFLCYNCHTYAAWPYWDPYGASCSRFRIVIYDDPYYYPAYRYRGTRVVYHRPRVIVPRYVFKDRTPDEPYVATVRARPVDAHGRRLIDPGVTGRSLTGDRRVPAPIARPNVAPVAPNRAPPDRRAVPAPTMRGVPQSGARPNTLPDRRVIPSSPSAPQPTLERRDPKRTPTPHALPTPRSRPTPQAEPRRMPSPPSRAEPQRAPPTRSAPPVRRSAPPVHHSPPPVRHSPPGRSASPPSRRGHH